MILTGLAAPLAQWQDTLSSWVCLWARSREQRVCLYRLGLWLICRILSIICRYNKGPGFCRPLFNHTLPLLPPSLSTVASQVHRPFDVQTSISWSGSVRTFFVLKMFSQSRSFWRCWAVAFIWSNQNCFISLRACLSLSLCSCIAI